MELGELPAGWETAELSEICLVNPTIDKSAIADDLAVSFVPMPAVEARAAGSTFPRRANLARLGLHAVL
jgi:hypothetical protein